MHMNDLRISYLKINDAEGVWWMYGECMVNVFTMFDVVHLEGGIADGVQCL